MATALGQKLARAASVVGSFLAMSFVLVFWLRGCVGVAYSPASPRAYAVEGADGRLLECVLLPGNFALFFYAALDSGHREAVAFKWRGTYGDHYGFGVWYMDGPLPGPNWRIYRAGFEPVYMEMEVLSKHVEAAQSVFPEEGTRSREVVLFSTDGRGMIFEGMLLEERPLNPELTEAFLIWFDEREEVRSALSQFARPGKL